MRGLVVLLNCNSAAAPRSRLTALLLICIAILAVPALARAQDRAGSDESPLGSCTKSFYLTFNGPLSGTFKTSGSISGDVNLLCDGTWIFADVISWDEKTAYASGNLFVTQEGLRVNADRMEMDRETKLGSFYHAYGTARLSEEDRYHDMFGTMEPEIMFIAEKIEKIGPRSYRLTDGMFSTCVQPNPRWQITGKNATVILQDHASMKNAALRVKGVPVLYIPYMYYPMKKQNRATGFLIPTYSASGVRGQGFGDAFFWAIDRSQDATFYYTKYTKSGQIGASEYRYRSTNDSFGNVYYQLFDESERIAPDGSIERQARRTHQLFGDLRQALPHGFVLTGKTWYVSDITTQALYEQNIYNQSRRDRELTFSVTGPLARGLRVSATTSQRDYSNGATFARKGTLPVVDVTFDSRPLSRKPGPFHQIYFGAIAQTVYNDVRPDLAQPEFDRALWRFNSIATLRAPLSNLSWLSVRGNAAWQFTNWSQTVDPLTGTPVSTPLTRNLFVLSANAIGPSFEKDFKTPDNSYASAFKHEIQPFADIYWTSPFNQRDHVIQIDPQIDQLVGGTTQINYGLTNVLRAARKANNNKRLKEMMRVTISQSWYSNAQAGAIDPNYPTATINTFAPVQLLFSTKLTDSFETRFQVYIDPTVHAVRSYSLYGFLINGDHLTVEGGWQKRQYLPNVPGYDNPNNASHFINQSTTFRLANGKYGGRYIFNYDLLNTSFLQQRIVGYYSSQCCGISVDYQMMNVSQFQLTGVPRDRRLAITFTLAGIGSFASPLGAFGR